MKIRGTTVTRAACLCAILVSVSAAAGQTPTGTDFTYQGRLELSGDTVNDTADFQFTLWRDDVSIDPNDVVGATIAKDNVNVADGLFTVGLGFGADAFNGQALWLEIAVRSPAGSGVYTTLSPRQALTPAPYALALRGLRTELGQDVNNVESWNVIGGHPSNIVEPGVSGITVFGGTEGAVNSVSQSFCTVGGGQANTAGGFDPNDANATVGGGVANLAAGEGSTVGGGFLNSATGRHSAIGGGSFNTSSGTLSTINGGSSNLASGSTASVSGGQLNVASGGYSTVGGGIGVISSGTYSTAAGGFENEASGLAAAASGGASNAAAGQYSTVPGGRSNSAGGNYSLAAGHRAKVRDAIQTGDADGDEGVFVWADSASADFESTGPDQFLIRATGGVGIGTNAPTADLHISGGANAVGLILEADVANSNENGQPTITMTQDGGVVTAGLGFYDGANRFTIRTDDGSPSNVHIILEPDGNVGIGTTTPSEKLQVAGNICATGTIGTCSDARFKMNVAEIHDALSTVTELRGVSFDWRRAEFPGYAFSGDRQVGFIAQEVATVLPEVVSEGNDGYYSVDYGRLTPLLVQAVKELEQRNRAKDEQMAQMLARIQRLEDRANADRANTEVSR